MKNTFRQVREDRGFSQTEAARKLDISRQALSSIESGKSTPSVGTLIKASKLFNVSMEELAEEAPQAQ